MTLRWDEPIEAVREDGQVVPVTYERPQGFKSRHWVSGIAPEDQDEPVLFNSDGTHAYDSGWRIRNVTTQTPPNTPAGYSDEVVERCVALVKRIGDGFHLPYANDDAISPSDAVTEARAIVALLPEPVDADLIEARKIVAEMCFSDPHDRIRFVNGQNDDGVAIPAILAAIKRGRALAAGDRS